MNPKTLAELFLKIKEETDRKIFYYLKEDEFKTANELYVRGFVTIVENFAYLTPSGMNLYKKLKKNPDDFRRYQKVLEYLISLSEEEARLLKEIR